LSDFKAWAKGNYGNNKITVEGDDFDRPAYDVAVAEFQRQALGKPSGDMAKISEKLRASVVTEKGFIWDTKKPGFQVSREARIRVEAQVGVAAYANAEKVLGELGVPPTPENIQKLMSGK
jgi:hypothetical protein